MERQIKLLDQMRSVLRLKHMSIRTEEAYVSWIRRFILFHGKRHPTDMGAEEIRAFLTHLAVQRVPPSLRQRLGGMSQPPRQSTRDSATRQTARAG